MRTDSTGDNARSFDAVTVMRDMIRNWWIALLVAAIAAMGAYMTVTQFYRPKYTATATLVVAYTDSGSNVYSDLTAANTLAGAFSQVLNSNVMKQKVSDALAVEEFTGTIETEIVPETNLLIVTVTADTPQMAWQASQALLDNYSQITAPIMQNVAVSVLKAPAFPVGASNPMNRTRITEIAALVGALAVFVLAGVFSFLRDTVKNEREFSKKVDGHLLTTVYAERKYKTIPALLQHRKTSILLSNPTTSFAFAETYKILRTKVEYAMNKRGHKVLMVASVIENEGKSTVTANLALALAQKGHRVILVDGDMRRPAVHKLFDLSVPNTNQVRSLVKGTTPLEEMKLIKVDFDLKLLVGRKPCEDSTDLIATDGMRRLLGALREQADYVLLDMPPMSLVSDAEYMAQLADASLLVVRQNAARTQDINDTVDVLREAHADFIGCVFNNVHTSVLSSHVSGDAGGRYGYGYGYGYGHYGHYGAYGREDSSSRKNTPKNGQA